MPSRSRAKWVPVRVKNPRQNKEQSPGSDQSGPGLWRSPATELAARRCATRSAAARTFVLVTEDQPALLQVIGRHLDRHPIARQRLDPVLFHLAGGVGDDLGSGIELHAVTSGGGGFGHQSFEREQLFFSHGSFPTDRRPAWALGAVGVLFLTAVGGPKSSP